jgi:hypothetical protein
MRAGSEPIISFSLFSDLETKRSFKSKALFWWIPYPKNKKNQRDSKKQRMKFKWNPNDENFSFEIFCLVFLLTYI